MSTQPEVWNKADETAKENQDLMEVAGVGRAGEGSE